MMGRAWAAVLAAVAMAMGGGLQGTWGQDTVGALRIVDEAGTTIGQEAAPAGEKLFRLPAGATAFLVAMDFEGASATEVELRVMGPSGTVLFTETQTVEASGTYAFEVTSDGLPFAEQEYVVNAYVGAEGYLADSLQLIIGEAQLPTPEAATGSQSSSLDPLSVAGGAAGGVGAANTGAAFGVPGGPSKAVLALAVAGIVALMGIVLWAGWSATRRA